MIVLLAVSAHADGREDDRNFDRSGQDGAKAGETPASQVNPKKATVVIGLATTQLSDRSMTAGLVFKRIDPATKGWVKAGLFGRGAEEFKPIRTTSAGWLQSVVKVDPTKPEFVVEEINAGEWILTDIYNVRGPRNESWEYSHLFKEGDPMVPEKARGPRFKVEAGDVVYLGTFYLDMTRFPAGLGNLAVEEEAAKQKVEPALRSKLVYRELYILRN